MQRNKTFFASILPGLTIILSLFLASMGCDSDSAGDSDQEAMSTTPLAVIDSPGDGALIAFQGAIGFEGAGSDLEDGELAGGSLVWSSDVDGTLGSGRSLTIATLSLGPHRVTLTAIDSEGRSGTDSVDIVVGNVITLLHTNDMHSHFLGHGPNSDYTPGTTGDDTTRGGIARVAAKAAQIRAEKAALAEPVLMLDGGDFLMGTAFELLGDGQSAELSLMKEIGYDAAVLGNHEFDWKPEGLARIINAALAQGGGTTVPLLISNMVFDPAEPDDDELQALYDAGTIQPHRVIEANGLQVGLFGILGEGAAGVAPFASPLDFEAPAVAAAREVAALQAEGVDLIVCLSHGGVSCDQETSEDEQLALAVPEIDVIISGHTHTAMEEKKQVGDTVIVQAGSYTEYLGKLELLVEGGIVQVRSYELIPIDDSIAGDPAIQAEVDGYIDFLDANVFGPVGLQFEQTIAETEYDLVMVEAESNLGNLVADAIRNGIDRYEYNPADPSTKCDFAFESNGVIRDNILKGTTGDMWVADAFRAVPLGIGDDDTPGYPLISFYISGPEVKKGLEVLTTVYKLEGSDYFLQVSGLRFEYDPKRLPFDRVTAVYQVFDDGTEELIDTSVCNPELYKIGINLYVGQFMAIVGEFTYGILTIMPKFADGTEVVDFSDTVVHQAPSDEYKQWEAFLDFLGQLPDTTGNGVPDIPALYSGPAGRMTVVQQPSCFIAAAGTL